MYNVIKIRNTYDCVSEFFSGELERLRYVFAALILNDTNLFDYYLNK